MKKSSLYLLMAVAFVVAAISLYYSYHKQPEVIEMRDTTIIHDTLWKDTTIFEKQLVPTEVIKTKTDTVFTPTGDSLLLVTEKKTFEKRITMGLDTADVQVITQGINTSLESLKMRLRLHQVNTTEVVEVTKFVEKKKRYGIGPSISFGYDPLRKEWSAVVGIGININL